MRFSARSPSPSPSRRRRSLSYGLQPSSDSDSGSEDGSHTDSSSFSGSNESSSDASGSSAMSNTSARNNGQPSTSQSQSSNLSPSQRRYMEDTVAAIRLRTRHQDPYEEWAKRTRKDAFHTARRAAAAAQSQRNATQAAVRDQDAERQAALLKREADMIARQLAHLTLRQAELEKQVGTHWDDQQKRRRAHTELVIRAEEEKLRARQAEQRAAEAAAERARKEAAAKEEAEAQRKKEEAAKAAQEAEEAKVRAEREEEARKEAERVEQAKAQVLEAQAKERNTLGMTTPDQDWREARLTLKQLKTGPIARVKADRDLKKSFNENRRKITPRVGQLTNDAQSIASISQLILVVLRPQPPLHPDVYYASLSALAKAILLQAETEVTAEKRSANPLAKLTLNLISAVEGFSDIFWARLCQRTGGWAVPALVPKQDADGTPFTPTTYMKASGLREDETNADHTVRVAGTMRVASAAQFRLPALWTFFARVIGQPALLQSSLATELLSVALDVGGVHVRDVWGAQWIKLMALLYEGVTADPPRLGGPGPEARASRMRLHLEIERVMGSV
ncbi:GLE1-like protein-domain-containing protein [Gloeopeniophorella convolvens]|nr:GLE1-like protein-domain-containing protein [Gloeopeniophorella convolvens]